VKSLKIAVYFFSFLLILLLTGIIIERYVAGISFTDLSLFRREKESAYTMADEIGDLYLLNTSEYRMKLIFPYDFIDRDVDWWKIKQFYDQRLEVKDNQREQLRIYESCINAGFDPAIDVYDFIILTAVVKAGINISGTVYENPRLYNNGNLHKYISIDESDNKKSISLLLPEVEITDYYIEDRRPDSDNFPDAELTPGQWRDLVDFLNPLIVEKVIQFGILENARENSRILIEKILKDSGFFEVSFTGQDI